MGFGSASCTPAFFFALFFATVALLLARSLSDVAIRLARLVSRISCILDGVGGGSTVKPQFQNACNKK